MKIEYELFASFAVPGSRNSDGSPSILEIAVGTTVDVVLKQLGLPEDRPKLIFINGQHANEITPLKDGDRLGIFPPVAGG